MANKQLDKTLQLQGELYDINAVYADTAAVAVTANSANTATTADSATKAGKLTTARTISLTGDVTGSVSFDGSKNVSITATVADDSHSHSKYENQNAFSHIQVGSTKISADSSEDTLTLVAGSNITLTPSASEGKITIAATNTDTHHTAKNVVTNSATSTSNAAATNGSVRINLIENGAVRSSNIIKGTGATSVTSESDGTIKVTSTDKSHSPSYSSGLKLATGSGVSDLYIPAASSSSHGYMSKEDKSKLDNLNNVLELVGVSTTDPRDGNPTIAGVTTYEKGNVVIYQGREYLYSDSSWYELGDANSFALKGHTHSYSTTSGSKKTGISVSVTDSGHTHTATSSLSNATAAAAGGHSHTLTAKGSVSITDPKHKHKITIDSDEIDITTGGAHTHTISGTVSAPKFSGTAGTTGNASPSVPTVSAVQVGSSSVYRLTFGSTTISHNHSFTPAGTVSAPTFSGSSGSAGGHSHGHSSLTLMADSSATGISASFTGSSATSSSVSNHTHTVSGTVSTTVKSGKASTTASVTDPGHTHSVSGTTNS